jgi:hypothetical protein
MISEIAAMSIALAKPAPMNPCLANRVCGECITAKGKKGRWHPDPLGISPKCYPCSRWIGARLHAQPKTVFNPPGGGAPERTLGGGSRIVIP